MTQTWKARPPLCWQDGRGQITVAIGWMVDNYNEGPIVSISAALSGKSNLDNEIDMFPRFTLSYVPIVGQQLVKSVSLDFDLGLSVEVSSGFSLLINPLLFFDVKEANITSGVVGIVL